MKITGHYQVTQPNHALLFDGNDYARALEIYRANFSQWHDVCLVHDGEAVGEWCAEKSREVLAAPATENDAGVRMFSAMCEHNAKTGYGKRAVTVTREQMEARGWFMVGHTWTRSQRLARDLVTGDTFALFVNQQWRDHEVIATADGLALAVYEMPNGREYLTQLPSASRLVGRCEWSDELRNASRPIGVRNAPKRWRTIIAERAL